MTKTPVICAWSGGKDSALMLHALKASDEYIPAMLLTTVTEPFNRISMHGVRHELLVKQAEALDLPLHEVRIPWPCPNVLYEEKMREAWLALKSQGYDTFAFGDLFLEDIRAYRDKNLCALGLKAIYPIWGKNTAALAREFIELGFKAKLCCVDSKQIDGYFSGRDYDARLLEELPNTADPCGENGEFHTFVYDGPIFKHPIPCIKGEVVTRETFVYCDLL